jgi:aspartate aminotransferase-like enzyme
LTVFSASEKALKRAAGMEGRGYYFDYIEFAANDDKNNTPSTPCISQIYAMDKQLDRIFAEGLENRWARHCDLADHVRTWLTSRGFELFPEADYCSQTLTCVRNTRDIDLAGLKKNLAERGFAFDDGYGKIKGTTFRIAHMGDMTRNDLDGLFAAIIEIMPDLA